MFQEPQQKSENNVKNKTMNLFNLKKSRYETNQHYYIPIKVRGAISQSCIEYGNNDSIHINLSLFEYFHKIPPHLKELP